MTPVQEFKKLLLSRALITKNNPDSIESGFNVTFDLSSLEIWIDVLLHKEADAIKEAFYCGLYEPNNYERNHVIYYEQTYGGKNEI
jgi:hypothetical protein